MGGIFISYRRDDSGLYAGRLRDTLSHHFGEKQVFRDRDSINPGELFPRIVDRELSSCDALLALIGPTWLAVEDGLGRRRLDDPDDLVRLEIATVLARGDEVLVIPVLFGTASMPAAADLPKPLAALAERQAFPITDEDSWGERVARLTRELEKVVKPRAMAPRPLHLAVPQSAVTAGAVPRTQRREHAVATLAKSVRRQWNEEAKIRGLFNPDPMQVHWTLAEHDVSDHSRHIFPGRVIFEGTSDRIDELTEQFQKLLRRRLVILGGPGSGKTTLAVQLLLRLLEVRTPTEPVPVLLTANSWNTTAHPRMQDWLASRLDKDYPALRAIDRAMPKELADGGMVLPVIDGLDELDPAYRSVLLTRLNDSLDATDSLVLTSRTDEYVDAVENADVLTAAAVIEARPLTALAAADYLDSCLPPRQRPGWNAILDTLRRNDDTPLAEECATPLGLWLLRSVYIENKGDPTPLIDPALYPDAEAIKGHLFDELIPALISKRRPVRGGSDPLRPRRDLEPDATRRWLGYLAVQLRGERDLRWWQLATAVPTGVITMLMVLVVGLVGVPIAELIYWPMPEGGLERGLVLGLVFGLVVGLRVGRKVRRTPEPGYANLRLRGRGRALARHLVGGRRRAVAVGLGVVVGPLGTLLATLAFDMSHRLPFWEDVLNFASPYASLGLAVWLAVAAAKWVRSPGSNDRSRTPISTYRGSRNLITLSVLVAGLMGTLAFGTMDMPLAFRYGLSAENILALKLGLAYGLAVGLVVGPAQEPAWLGFVVTARWLAFRGKLPWRIMGFLDDAHRLGLLRTAGSVYQFRHAELQDHLAKTGETAARVTPRGRGARSPGPLRFTSRRGRSELNKVSDRVFPSASG